MEYRLDNYSRNPQMLLDLMARNCKARRLEKGYSRKTLSVLTGVPAPTIERFERSGKISLEAFCQIVIQFDYFDEMAAILNRTKYSTSQELESINKNQNRKNGR